MTQEDLIKIIVEWFDNQEEYFDDETIDDVCIDGWFNIADLAAFILERLSNHAPSVRKDSEQISSEGPDGDPANW